MEFGAGALWVVVRRLRRLQNRCLVAKKKIISVNSEIEVQISTSRVNKENIKDLIKNYQIVLDCTDNFESRYIINDECYRERKILIAAALHSFEVQLFAFKAWSGKNSPCYRCIFPKHKISSEIGNCNDHGIISPVECVTLKDLTSHKSRMLSWVITYRMKHCQRHNGPEE